MNKVIVATATFILGALVGFSFQTVTAQEHIDESSIWDIYHSPTQGSGNFYVVRVERASGKTWVSINGKDYKRLNEK